MSDTGKPDRLIRIKELLERVPLGRTTIHTRMKAGKFPQSVNLGGGVVAWRESEIDAWIDARPRTLEPQEGEPC